MSARSERSERCLPGRGATKAASTHSSSHMPEEASTLSWQTRHRVVASYLHVVQAKQSIAAGYSTSSRLPSIIKPRPHHVGIGAQHFTMLHPIPSGVSPLLWACAEDKPLCNMVHQWQTLQLLHGGDEPTAYPTCPLCADEVPADLHRHIILHCHELNTRRQATLSTLGDLLRDCEQQAQAASATVQPPPQAVSCAIRDCLHCTHILDHHADTIYRLILCGQWPWYWGRSASNQQVSKEEASVYSFPYVLHHKGAKRVSPPRAWRELQCEAAKFAGQAWRAVVSALLRDRHPDRLSVHTHARHLWWSIFGRDAPFPGHTTAEPSAVTKQTRAPKAARIRRFFPARAGQVPSHEGRVQRTLHDILQRRRKQLDDDVHSHPPSLYSPSGKSSSPTFPPPSA